MIVIHNRLKSYIMLDPYLRRKGREVDLVFLEKRWIFQHFLVSVFYIGMCMM